MAAVDVNDLIEFLTKCNDEDEAAAKTALKAVDISGDRYETWAELVQDCVCDDYTEDHVRIHDPARALRECAARRSLLLTIWNAGSSDSPFRPLYDPKQLDMVRRVALALVQSYVDRPGFRDEWRVT